MRQSDHRVSGTTASDWTDKGLSSWTASATSTLTGDAFFADPLLFRVLSDRYVMVEWKSGISKPEHQGQLNCYVETVHDLFRFPRQAPTADILVCDSKNVRTVRGALNGSTRLLAVTSYTYWAIPVGGRATPPFPGGIMAALKHDQGSEPEAWGIGPRPSNDTLPR